MRKHWWLHALKFAAFIAIAVVVAGAVVMHLWNWLLPDSAGWDTIRFWEDSSPRGLSHDRLLAGDRPAGPRAHPVRRLARARPRHAHALARAHGRALGTHDAR